MRRKCTIKEKGYGYAKKSCVWGKLYVHKSKTFWKRFSKRGKFENSAGFAFLVDGKYLMRFTVKTPFSYFSGIVFTGPYDWFFWLMFLAVIFSSLIYSVFENHSFHELKFILGGCHKAAANKCISSVWHTASNWQKIYCSSLSKDSSVEKKKSEQSKEVLMPKVLSKR